MTSFMYIVLILNIVVVITTIGSVLLLTRKIRILVPKIMQSVKASAVRRRSSISGGLAPNQADAALLAERRASTVSTTKQAKPLVGEEQLGGEGETSNNTQSVQDAGCRAEQHDVESGSPHKGALLYTIGRQHEPPAPVSALPTGSMVPTTPSSTASVRQTICDTPETKVSAGLGISTPVEHAQAVEQAKETYKNKLLQNKSNKRQKAKGRNENPVMQSYLKSIEQNQGAVKTKPWDEGDAHQNAKVMRAKKLLALQQAPLRVVKGRSSVEGPGAGSAADLE